MWKAFSFCLFYQLVHFNSFAQDDLKVWAGLQTNIGITKKWDLKLNFLHSSECNYKLSNDFQQLSATSSYDFNKKINGRLGYLSTLASLKDDSKYRIFARFMIDSKLNRTFQISNGVQAEKHSKNETRYSYRLIYINTLSVNKRLKFLNLTPSATVWLYYNMGGKPLQYYNYENGTATIKNNANGFHRARYFLNLNSKINKNFSISLYAMRQQEFNLFTRDTRKINVLNPKTGKISRPFNNYTVLGLNMSINFSLKKYHKNNSNEIQN